eukprot:gene16336-19432_t
MRKLVGLLILALTATVILAVSLEELDIAPETYVLNGIVFVDDNNNGYYDPGEPGFPGIRITLDPSPTYDNIDALGRVLPSQKFTSQSGMYKYDLLLDSSKYGIILHNPEGYYFRNYPLENRCSPAQQKLSVKGSCRTYNTEDPSLGTVFISPAPFQVPLIKNEAAIAETTMLKLHIQVKSGGPNPSTGSVNSTTAVFTTASSSTAYGGVKGPKMGLYGTYFIDANRNGIMEQGEAAFGGIPVSLFDFTGPSPQGQDGKLVSTPTVSFGDGAFFFGNLFPNYYYQVYASNPPNYVFGKLSTDFVCNDCIRPKSQDPGEAGLDADYLFTLPAYKIPLVPSPGTPGGSQKIPISVFITYPGGKGTPPANPTFAVTLDGFVYWDKNKDGYHQFGKEFGLPDAPIHIFDTTTPGKPAIGFTGAVIPATTTTSRNGWWRNDNLIPGHTYRIRVGNPAGYKIGQQYPDYSCQDCIRLPVASDQPIIGKYIYTLPIFKVPMVKAPGTPPGSEFVDLLVTIPPIENETSAPITLWPGGTPPGQLSAPASSGSASGQQSSNGASVGITQNPTNGPNPGTAENSQAVSTKTPTDPSTNVPTADSTSSQSSTPSSGENPAPGTFGALTGVLYVDLNGNGIRDPNEPLLPGTTIYLIDPSTQQPAIDVYGRPIPPAVTDENGKYTFDNVKFPGPYLLGIEPVPGNLHNPGPIGPFTLPIDGLTRPSNPTDNVKSPNITPLGDYGLIPNGGGQCNDKCVISGNVFFDPNFNMIRDPSEPGINGVPVTIYLPGGNTPVGTVYTDKDGKWSFANMNPNIQYRIEYRLPDGTVSTGGAPVKFVTGNTTNISLGIVWTNSTGIDRGANFPRSFATTCFVKGANNGPYRDHTTVISFLSNAVGKGYEASGKQFMLNMAVHGQTGAVWGIAFDPQDGGTYAAAYHKVGSDIGPYGTGAIYKINSKLGIIVYCNLNALFGTTYTGPYVHSFDGNERDLAGTWVGKTAYGQMITTKDYIYVTNLFRNDVVSIPLRATPTKDNVVAINVPNPGCSVKEDFHIFPVTVYQNELYTGGVCAGELGSTLSTYILKFDRKNRRWINVLSYTMNYDRGCRFLDNYANCVSAAWTRWTNTDASSPILSSIIFDDRGHLVMGFKDRAGDQGPTVPAPEMLVACLSATGYYFLENNAVCGGFRGANPNLKTLRGLSYGPGGGQYFDIKKEKIHDYVGSFGSVKGGPQVIVGTGFDAYEVYEGSIYWFNSTTGRVLKAFSIYLSISSKAPTFGKSNGLGDITAIYDNTLAQYQVGRIWWDLNKNGIQDAGEPGMQNVTSYLIMAGATVPVGIVKSDAGGYLLYDVQANVQYACVIPLTSFPNGAQVQVSPANADKGPGGDLKDSDGVLDQAKGVIFAQFTSPLYGGYNYNNCHFGITFGGI